MALDFRSGGTERIESELQSKDVNFFMGFDCVNRIVGAIYGCVPAISGDDL